MSTRPRSSAVRRGVRDAPRGARPRARSVVQPALGLLLAIAATGCGNGEVTGASSGSGASAPPARGEPPASSAPTPSSAPPAASTPPSAAPSASQAPVAAPGTGTIAKLLADALANPDKYNGKPARVEGVFVGTRTRDIGSYAGDSYTPLKVTDVLIADSKEDPDHAIMCEMNGAAPADLQKGDALVGEGRGYMDMPAAGVKLVIGSCKITKK